MSDLAVAHLAFRQADERSTGMDERVGILAQQAVVSGLARERDGLGLGLGAVAPAVEDMRMRGLGRGMILQRSPV